MSSWSHEDLDSIGNAEEIRITPERLNDPQARTTTIWVVRLGDDLYVRAGAGPAGSWYRQAINAGRGDIVTDAIRRQVTFETNPDVDANVIDDLYRTKYPRYSNSLVPL